MSSMLCMPTHMHDGSKLVAVLGFTEYYSV